MLKTVFAIKFLTLNTSSKESGKFRRQGLKNRTLVNKEAARMGAFRANNETSEHQTFIAPESSPT